MEMFASVCAHARKAFYYAHMSVYDGGKKHPNKSHISLGDDGGGAALASCVKAEREIHFTVSRIPDADV